MSARAGSQLGPAAAPSDAALASSPGLRRRHQIGRGVLALLIAATLVGVVVLGVLLVTIFARGVDWLSWGLITEVPSRFPEKSGVKVALYGTVWVISLTALFALPVGIGAAIYLEEYAPNTWWTKLLHVNIANLAGVPSVVYGLLGLGVFVELMRLDRSVIAGALTLALLILPVIIIASREALRSVPSTLRQGAFALGATRWQVVRHHVLPAALPGIMTGTILAFSRAIGETAPLLVAGAAGYLAFRPENVMDTYTVLPIQIYNWIGRPQAGFQELAAAGIIVLLAVLLTMNALAIYLRQRFSRARW